METEALNSLLRTRTHAFLRLIQWTNMLCDMALVVYAMSFGYFMFDMQRAADFALMTGFLTTGMAFALYLARLALGLTTNRLYRTHPNEAERDEVIRKAVADFKAEEDK